MSNGAGFKETEGPRRLAAVLPHRGDLTRMTEPFGALPRKCYYYYYLSDSAREGL
jgi:hypothetical protein